MRQRAITLIRFLIPCAVLSAVVSFAVEQASAQDANKAPAKQEERQFNPTEYSLKQNSRIENVKVELAYLQNARTIAQQGGGSGGPEWLSVSTKNGEFDLGMLRAGEYELRFSDTDGGATANRGITINTTHVEYASNKKVAGNADPKHNSDVGRLTMTLTGVVGGPLKQELQGQLNAAAGELSRPGKPKYKNIVLFKADGRSQVKGTLKHDSSYAGDREHALGDSSLKRKTLYTIASFA